MKRTKKVEQNKKSIKFHVSYSRNVDLSYVHGILAKRLQSTTITIVSGFLKYAGIKIVRMFDGKHKYYYNGLQNIYLRQRKTTLRL